ncbi:IclR family transcriptional regulator [Croceibacterium mercuriale]|uniref:IclR family transcriptional regulator n=1 Tax=Croceibacterium mercuriale TaxID=1572751 RepID=UPI00068A5E0E|nr:IclR family transcriptional regulator [Croceibacterium mercuriale]
MAAEQDEIPPAALSPAVKSATRTLDIIEYVVATSRPLVAQEIAVALGIPVSSLSYLLATLVERGYIVREGRRYLPGPGLERLQTRRHGPTLADRAAPLVQWLRAQLNETASFLVRVDWEAEVLVTQSSSHALRYSLDVGSRLPLHALAGGRALLTLMDDGDLARYFAESTRRRLTPSTITNENGLRQAIAQARDAGIAETDEEYSLGIHGMACVVMSGDVPVGALSVAIPKARLTSDRHDKAIKMLQRAAAMLDS